MSDAQFERLGSYVDDWVRSAPSPEDLDPISIDAQDALIEAGMVQFNPEGWDFKLHEKHPDAPRALFKLMIREAPGVDTNPDYYDRFVLPSILEAGSSGMLDDVRYVLGYPNAGTPIAEAFVRQAGAQLGVSLEQIKQSKITHPDGKRELGEIVGEFEEDESTLTIDDTATGGDTKIEGWQKVNEHSLSYAGLVLIVERDPLGTALVSERTGAGVYPSMHWMTLVKRAATIMDLPQGAVEGELDYPSRLFEWNVQNNNLGSLPTLDASV